MSSVSEKSQGLNATGRCSINHFLTPGPLNRFSCLAEVPNKLQTNTPRPQRCNPHRNGVLFHGVSVEKGGGKWAELLLQ